MEEELKTFFESTEFYRRFIMHADPPLPNWDITAVDYSIKFETKEIRLHFAQHNNDLKILSVWLCNRPYLAAIYWRDINELSFILDRLPEIRWSNPLCSDPELLTMQSYSLQMQS
jgi:hypothetical protein